MDKGAETTQRIVIAAAIILGIIIVSIIGYSLYNKAKIAEGELANKIALDRSTKKTTEVAGISLTNEAKNRSGFDYDGLIQKSRETATTSSNLEIVNETTPIEAPKEVVEEEEFTEIIDLTPTEPVEPTPPTSNNLLPLVDNNDRPLTREEILRIRRLPVENSPAGNLQNILEVESKGEYTARYK